MKYYLEITPMGLKKIVNGSKKIELRLLDEQNQKLRLDDVVEFYSRKTRESVVCLVTGLVIFESFDKMIEVLPAEIFGYDDKTEIRVRVNRLYSLEDQLKNKVIGIFIMPIQQNILEKEDTHNYFDREEREELELVEQAEKEHDIRSSYKRLRQSDNNLRDEDEIFNFEFVGRDMGHER